MQGNRDNSTVSERVYLDQLFEIRETQGIRFDPDPREIGPTTLQLQQRLANVSADVQKDAAVEWRDALEQLDHPHFAHVEIAGPHSQQPRDLKSLFIQLNGQVKGDSLCQSKATGTPKQPSPNFFEYRSHF